MPDSDAPATLLQQIDRYTETLAADPSSPVFVQLAEAYRRLDMLDDALQVAEGGLQRQSDLPSGWVALGRIHVQRGDRIKAQDAFSKALTLDADFLPALTGLARIQAQLKEYEACRRTVSRIQVLRPDDPIAKQLEASLPVESTTTETVGDLAAKTNKPAPKKEEPFSTGTIAEIYIRQGFLKRALKVYRDILAENPQNEAIRRKLIALKKRISEEEEQESGGGRPSGTNIVVPDEVIVAHVTDEIPAPPVAERLSPDRVLTVFNRWLDGIQRRKHVQ